MQDHGLSWNPSSPDIWYSTGKSFLRSQPGPCMLQHKLPLFCLQQRQESSSTCLRFHWRLLLRCPSDVCSPGFKHAQLPQVFSWTLLINQRMSSTDGFPLCLTLPFKLDSKSKARYSCKEGTGSFGWTCFVSKAAEYQGAFSPIGLFLLHLPMGELLPTMCHDEPNKGCSSFRCACHFVCRGESRFTSVWLCNLEDKWQRGPASFQRWTLYRCPSSIRSPVWTRHCTRHHNKGHCPCSQGVQKSPRGDKCTIT